MILWHVLPWEKIFSGKKLPPRLIAFVLGVGTINGALTWLFLSWGIERAVLALWVATVSGGMATFLAYGSDWLFDLIKRNKELEEHNRELEERIKELAQKQNLND
jgi:hypothetical protein